MYPSGCSCRSRKTRLRSAKKSWLRIWASFISVFLQAYIFERTRENIGLNTLKRIWNYGNTPVVPRIFTLDILSKAVGYRNFEDVKQFYGEAGSESSDKVLGKVVSSSDLRPGDRVTLCWNPGRRCTVEYLGSNAYRVVSSERTKLKPGNTISSSQFLSVNTFSARLSTHSSTTAFFRELHR
jgi:hypothetical protein